MNKKLKIGLFGYGNVGQGFYELATTSTALNLKIKSIGIRNDSKKRVLSKSLFTTNPEDIINDPEIDIVVELIDDADVAFDLLKRSLQNRKPVVTANKKMLAYHLKEICRLQHKFDTPVLYEGAVCGSIPIIQNLENYYAFDTIHKIEGILNGSTNYILTKMIDEKLAYGEALEQAKKLGYAESDPVLDVSGNDSKYKLSILLAHAFGCIINPDGIISVGISNISQRDILFAKRQGCTIKLVAKAEKIANTIYGIVAPRLVPLESPLARVENEFNGIHIFSKYAGSQLLTGKGAGGLPTGLAVLSDVAKFAEKSSNLYRYHELTKSYPFETGLIKVFVSFSGANQPQTNDFVEFEGGSNVMGEQTMEGYITAQKLVEWAGQKDLSVILAKDHNFASLEENKTEEFSLA